MMISVNSMSMGPLPHFICCKRAPWVPMLCRIPWQWIRYYIVNGWGLWQKYCTQGRQIHNQSIFSRMNKMLSCPWWKWSNVISLLPGSWLITLGDVAILGSQFCSRFCRLGTQQWPYPGQPWWVETHVDEFMHNHHWIMAALFLRPLDDDKVGGKRG